MNLRRQGLSLALVSIMSLGVTQAASAATILVFGQAGVGNTVTAVASGGNTVTTITGTNVAVSITGLENVAIPPAINAFLNFTFTSSGPASLNLGNIDQSFGGTFSIRGGANNTGANYLSLTTPFSDLGSGSGNAFTLSAGTAGGDTIGNWTSDFITSLALERALSFAFTAVTPAVAICGTTICGFTASISGNFSGNLAQQVPEPASLLLFGSALVGIAARFRRRR